jgi:tellurite methyltransferase
MNKDCSQEKEKLELFWEDGYSNKLVSTMGGPSIEVYEMSFLVEPGQKVVDLGCGEGRNSLYLAQKGCDVTAVDISSSGIKKVNIAAEALGVKVRSLVCDLNDYEADDDYDVVLAHSSLHFLTREKWRSILDKLKERTKIGGLHSLTVLIPTEKYPFEGPLLTNGHKNSFALGELKEFYSDWEIIRYDAYLKQDQHPGIPIHSHYTEKVVCRKNPDMDKRGNDYAYKSLYSGPHDLPAELFNNVQIGDTEKTVIYICGEPRIVNEVNFGKAMGAKNILDNEYTLKDLFYGKTAFQLINGEVRGKYIYDTEPVKVRAYEK